MKEKCAESLCSLIVMQCVFVSLTGDIELEIQLLIAATVHHLAAKGHILVLTGRVEGQVAHSCVVPIWSLFTFNVVGRLNRLPISGPGERDRGRVEAVCMAFKLTLCFQHHPLLRD